jgi:hypothetical protein
VSTRRLIIVALLCGLAILVAGGIQLFRISGGEDRVVEVLAEGQTATVGGVTLAVESSARDAAEIVAEVTFAPAEQRTTVDADHFQLLVGGELSPPSTGAAEPGDCPATLVVEQAGLRCRLRFPARDGTATLGFGLSGEQRTWRLRA